MSFLSSPVDPAWASHASWAEQLCSDHGIDSAPVLSQQFLLAPSGTAAPATMRGIALGNWILYHGANLPVATAAFGNGRIAVLGLAVDPDGMVITTARLNALTALDQPLQELLNWLNDSAGRYAIIVVTGTRHRVYLDSLGSLGAVYDKDTMRVGSTTNLVLTRAPQPNTDYPLTTNATTGSNRFAFGHTPDTSVKRLLPNHFLDLDLWMPVRHWPGPNDVTEPTPDREADVVRGIARRLEQVITSLANHLPGNVHLPLSGGLDSRLLLSCAKPALDKIALFSHVENSMSRKDLRLARHLAKRVNAPLREIDPIRHDEFKITSDSRLKHLGQLHRIITGLNDAPQPIRHEVLLAHKPGGIFLRGNGSDFLKAVLWRRGGREYAQGLPHDTRTGIRMMMLSDKTIVENPAIQGMYEDWYATLPGSARHRAYDLMFAEQFLSHGFGNLLYSFINNFYICPFNDRRLLGAATSLSPTKRQQLHYNLAITDWRAPELSSLHFARPAVNQHINAMRSDKVDRLSL
ncbi:hypothetical protein [Roseovarius pelagicus]|uniref:Asparagine synthase (Glutamine-hydrolysing) n=1 Tax=Roseovarius pelagicus TaxID=2980108 RepID=A0ABY6DAG8_9RHOB|nr:hypothetical protein [Roseovarius pelagicus]UXX83121.1 hypothetical protein N7U68_18915 [Roseovarius pelagicus]